MRNKSFTPLEITNIKTKIRPANVGLSLAGFTLIELLIVIAILSIIVGVAIPRFRGFSSQARLNSQARRFVGAVQYVYELAAKTGRPHRLNYNFEKQNYGITYMDKDGVFQDVEDILAKKRQLPCGIRLKNIQRPEAKIDYGITYTQFSPKGFVEKTIICLEDDSNNVVSIIINPLTAEAEITKGYVEIDG